MFENEMIDKYRPIPFWSWNDKLERKELLNQVHWMGKNGMGGFFMHARSGLQTEYLSDEWMDCIEACADAAEILNMKAWVYDENGWPSGFAGMKLLENEENRDKYIEYNIGHYDEEADVHYLLTENKLVRTTQCGEGEYLNLHIRTSASTADILNPEVVEQFLSLTHEQYKKRFGDKFGEKIEGFFTDEPQYYRWATPYTTMMERYFKKQFDEDIFDSLGLLFVEKEGYRQFRYRYWKAMQELMLKNFAEKIYCWCDENGVKLTGHYVEENKLSGQMMCCGGIMPFYEYEHIPGIDWLGIQPKITGPLPARQVSSVAVQLGKNQVLTESFGCCGWDVTPAELKQIVGYQYVNGVNMLCHHLIPYSERGNRKYDYPAHYSEINPWVKEGFEEFNNYFTKLGCLLGEGKQQVNVAVLHPIRSAYFDYKRELEKENFGIEGLETGLYSLCEMLSQRGIEYHFLDETLMEKYGFVKDDKIGCGECSYEYLILPYIVTMDSSTEQFLNIFCKNGGKVLILGQKPQYCEAELYNYDYLECNCTIDDIMQAQPYKTSIDNSNICSTYRIFNGKPFLYVMNVDDNHEQTQVYDFGKQIHSFLKWDIMKDTYESAPLTVSLQPREDAVLIPCEDVYEEKPGKKFYEFRVENDEIAFEKNYLVVDTVKYSYDNVMFSEPWPISALFQKLLKGRYEGEIFLKYEFDVQVIPEQICLRYENNNELQAWLNGKILTEIMSSEYSYERVYDITSFVHKGKNEFVLAVKWHEDELVYRALFGEQVTEALKNCIVYDSELQPIYLEGTFGVYPEEGYWVDEHTEYVSGKNFFVGETPTKITELVTDGFPFFAGKFTVSRQVYLDNDEVILKIPGNYQIAEVTVNGVQMPQLLFGKEVDISDAITKGTNDIKVCYCVSNRNLLGPSHCIYSKYQGATPWMFEHNDTWEENHSSCYHEHFDLRKFLWSKKNKEEPL